MGFNNLTKDPKTYTERAMGQVQPMQSQERMETDPSALRPLYKAASF